MRRFLPVFLACMVVSVGLASWEGSAQQTAPAAPGTAPKVGGAIKEKMKEKVMEPIDLNGATEGQLESLPGLQKGVAKKIAAGRPYKTPEELVTKKILSKASFEKIKHLVEVKP